MDGCPEDHFVKVIGNIWDMKISVQDLHQPKPDLVQEIELNFLKDRRVNLEKYNQIPPRLDSTQAPKECLGAITVTAVHIWKAFKLMSEDDTFRQVDLFNTIYLHITI